MNERRRGLLNVSREKGQTFRMLKSVSAAGKNSVTIDVSDLNCDVLWVNFNGLTVDAADYVYCYANAWTANNSTRFAYTASNADQAGKFAIATSRSVEIDGTTMSRYVYPLSGVFSAKQALTLANLNALVFKCYYAQRKFSAGTIDLWGWA